MSRQQARGWPLMLAAGVLLLAACSPAAKPTYGPQPSGPTAIPTQQTVATVSSRTVGRLGQVLVNPAGDTLYVNTTERTPGAGCAVVCRRTWPLLLAPATGSTAAAGAASAALLGVVSLAGERVLTYGGHVLHLYVGDSGPGGAAGQNVQNVWAAVTIAGAPAVGDP